LRNPFFIQALRSEAIAPGFSSDQPEGFTPFIFVLPRTPNLSNIGKGLTLIDMTAAPRQSEFHGSSS
jgi:hypothetical protein